MQTVGRVLLSQLRPQMLQGSPAVTAAAVAAAVGHQSLFGSVRWFSSEGESTEGLQRLYIGNISFDTSPADIEQAFQKFGKVHDCNLPRRHDGKHKGFGFVELEAAAAETAIREMNDQEFMGRALWVKPAEPREAREPREPREPRGDYSSSPRGDYNRAPRVRREVTVRPGFTRLYVGNLNFRTTAADLGKHFQQFGAVQDCVIPLDHAGRSKGFGFVELDDAGAAKAVQALDGATFDGRQLRVRGQEAT